MDVSCSSLSSYFGYVPEVDTVDTKWPQVSCTLTSMAGLHRCKMRLWRVLTINSEVYKMMSSRRSAAYCLRRGLISSMEPVALDRLPTFQGSNVEFHIRLEDGTFLQGRAL